MFEVRRFNILGNTCSAFTVFRGQCLCVSAPSGAGKTVLLRAIADLDRNDAEIYLQDVNRDSFPPSTWRSQVIYVPSESAWWADTVEDHFPEGWDASGLKALGLDPDLMKAEVSRLSSGERQRLSLLRVLARKPKVLLLDEPTANLDDVSAKMVESLIAKYLREEEACAIWVSHDEAQRERVSSGGLVLKGTQWVVQ